MSILIDGNTRVLVQGITGRDGSFHARSMRDYGTNVVAGVTPGKAGVFVDGIEVFNTVSEAVKKTDANTSVIYVPASFAVDAIYEAIDAGIKVIVCITEGIPVLDMIKVCDYIKRKDVCLIGGNCPGIISPGKCKVGIMPGYIHRAGGVGIVSRSGTLTYEVVYSITQAGLGQSSVVGIGGDPICGVDFVDILKLFESDPETEVIVMIGEIGGVSEEAAALAIKNKVTKPVFGFIAGRTAPAGKRMGHAGAIICAGKDTAEAKIKIWREAGINVLERPDIFGERIAEYVSASERI